MPKKIREDDEKFESNMVEVMNISSETMKFELDGQRYKMAPRQVEKIHKSYATARQMSEERDPVPSTIELLTNKKVLPVTDKRVKPFLPKAQEAT